MWTGPQTWKVKRLRRDPRVVVSASDSRGRTRGESHEGVVLGLFNRLGRVVTRKQPAPSAYIEIVDP
jgi:hypothetical protein